jgi:hypothetical protein
MSGGRRGTQFFRRGAQFLYGSDFRASLNSSSKTLRIVKRDAEGLSKAKRDAEGLTVQRYPPTESLCGTGPSSRRSDLAKLDYWEPWPPSVTSTYRASQNVRNA